MEQPKTNYEDKTPGPEADVYIEQLLASIDTEELTRFLSEQLRRAGFAEDVLRERFYPPEDTTVVDEIPNAIAWADGNRINFEPRSFFGDVNAFQHYLERKKAPGSYYDREVQFHEIATLALLHTFIHEQLHHLTFTDYRYIKEEKRSDEVMRLFSRKTGIERQVLEQEVKLADADDASDELLNSENRQFFRGLNEGLTELLAQELALEYVRQYALIKDRDITRETASFWAEHGSYKEERYMVEQLAAVFAEMTEVPYDIMLKSFYHEYVTNGHLLPPEFENVLAEYLPENIDRGSLKADISLLRRSMTAKSFKTDGDLAQKIECLVRLLPKDKAQHCREILLEIKQKYYPDKNLRNK
jgi:hypothetical protein